MLYIITLIMILMSQSNAQKDEEEVRSKCIIDDLTHTRTYYPLQIPQNATKFTIIGLFPAWVTLKNRFNRSGFVWFEVAKYAINEVNKVLAALKVPTILQLIAYDTCNTVELAESALLEVLLNSTTTDLTLNCTDCCCQKPDNKVIGIIGPASSNTVGMIEKFLSSDRTPLISYSATSIRFDDKELYPMFMRTIPPDNLQAKMILDVLLYFKWNFVTIVANDNEYGRMGFYELQKLFAQYDICTAHETFFVYPFKENEIREIITDIKNEPHSKVIILWASGPVSQSFFKKVTDYKLYHKTWVVTESVGTSPKFVSFDKNVVHGLLSVVPYAGVYTEFDQYFRTLDYASHSDGNLWLKNFFENNLKLNKTQLLSTTIGDYWHEIPTTKNGYVRNAIYAYANALKSYVNDHTKCSSQGECTVNNDLDKKYFFEQYLQNGSIQTLNQSPASFNKDGNINVTNFHLYSLQPGSTDLVWKKLGEWDQSDGLQVNANFTWAKDSNEVPHSMCSTTCGPGQYALAHDSCCWTCIACEQGYVKSDIGRHACQKCPKGTLSNSLQTFCNVIQEEYLKYNTTKGIILYIVVALISTTATLFLLTFIFHRKTPIVLCSQYHASLLQITSLLVLPFCILLNTIKPTGTICTARICTIGVLLSLAYISTFIKSQRLILIFRSDCIVTRKKKRTALSVEIGTVILLVSINIALLLAFYLYEPFDMEKSKVTDGLQHVGCNTKLPFFIQIIYVMGLAVTCGVQAFRARKLPQNYNETRLISYAMFTSCTVLVIIFPLYGSAPTITDATFSSSLLLLVADYVILLFMYSYKFWIIIARPRLNNHEIFHKNRLRSIERRISKDMMRRRRSQSVESFSVIDNVEIERLSTPELYSSLRINTHADKKSNSRPSNPINIIPKWMKTAMSKEIIEEKPRSETTLSELSIHSTSTGMLNVNDDSNSTSFSIAKIDDMYY